MSAMSSRPKAPIAVDTPTESVSTAAVVICAPERLRVDDAQVHLAATCDALNDWFARCTGEGHSYVADGHEAVRLIDAATRELHRVRAAALVGEIRADEDERVVRVDRMLAKCRARQSGDLPYDGRRPGDGGMA